LRGYKQRRGSGDKPSAGGNRPLGNANLDPGGRAATEIYGTMTVKTRRKLWRMVRRTWLEGSAYGQTSPPLPFPAARPAAVPQGPQRRYSTPSCAACPAPATGVPRLGG